MLSETWINANDDFRLDGFTCYNFPFLDTAMQRETRVAIFIRKSLKDGVLAVRNNKDIIVWLKLRKDFFGFTRDIYIANLYIVPENSTHLPTNVFGIIHQEVANVPDACDVILCGDFNAHTDTVNDCVIEVNGSQGDLSDLLPTEMLLK